MCLDQIKSEGNKIAQAVFDINGTFASCLVLQNLTPAEPSHLVEERECIIFDVVIMKWLDDILSMSLMPLADSADPYSYCHLVEPSTRSFLLIVSFKLKYTYQKGRNESYVCC